MEHPTAEETIDGTGERPLELRELATESEYEQCLDLQRATWGRDFREQVPPTILRISQKVGGVCAGALTPEGDLLGFVYGLTGVRNGELAHWSHMLAVRDEARGLGLGKRLKIYQRERLLSLGCEVMHWTFDPLVARNANLNLCRLGALPCEYVVDMYGNETGSELHSGLGTDRFVVEWRFGDPEVARRLAAGDRWSVAGPADGSAVVEPGDEAAGVLAALGRDRPEVFWVLLPADIDRVKREDRSEGLRWRDAMRHSMVWAFGEGYRVTGLAGDLRVDGRVWYRLDRSSD